TAYVRYHRIIPAGCGIVTLLSVRDLLSALEEVARFEAFLTSTAMPDSGREGLKITLTLSGLPDTVIVQAGGVRPDLAPTRWTIQTDLPAALEGLAEGEEFTIALNRSYLRECLKALTFSSNERMELAFNGAHLPMRIQPEGA